MCLKSSYSKTLRQNTKSGVSYFNKVYEIGPRFCKSLHLQISSLVGNFKKISAFRSPVYTLRFHETYTIVSVDLKALGKLKMAYRTRFC